MLRRSFLNSIASGAATVGLGAAPHSGASQTAKGVARFKLRYAPHPDMFKNHAGENILDQIRFAADQGFSAWEDNGLPGRTPALQEQIGSTLAKLGMTMGVFVAYASFDEPTFAVPDPARQEEVLTSIRNAVEIAKRVGARWFTVVPGSVAQQVNNPAKWNRYGGGRLAEGFQTANVIAMLRRCAALLEPHKLVMVLEPLNWPTDHGGVFLQRSDQAYAICKAVASPSCKILFDLYHQQITEGNIIPNLDRCWDEIGYAQCGDNPGRQEPGTGEMNYRNIFRHIAGKSREIVIGMEHGLSKPGREGELALLKAYRDADGF
jgi:hydroxypyruvate isomerase